MVGKGLFNGCDNWRIGVAKGIGAYDGLNMDGGGSTTLAIWQEDKGNAKDNVKILNHQAGGAERANGNNLGFYLVK